MMTAKTPTSAAVTAAMAPRRAAPSVRMNSTKPCTDCAPAVRRSAERRSPGKFCRVHGFDLVNGASGYRDPGSPLRAVRDDGGDGCAKNNDAGQAAGALLANA